MNLAQGRPGEPEPFGPMVPRRRRGGLLAMLGAAAALMGTGVLVGMKVAGGASIGVAPPPSRTVVEAAIDEPENEAVEEPEATAEVPPTSEREPETSTTNSVPLDTAPRDSTEAASATPTPPVEHEPARRKGRSRMRRGSTAR